MNRLDSLPNEVSKYIYLLCKIDKSIVKLQNMWRKYQAPKIIAAEFIPKCYQHRTSGARDMEFNSQFIVSIIKYMSKVLSGKENISVWGPFILELEDTLWVKYYNHGLENSIYNSIEMSIERLKEVFGDTDTIYARLDYE